MTYLESIKTKKSIFQRSIKKQKTNLARKKEIIEEIKKLIDKNQHDNNTYKNFKNLQDAFYNTGQVPRKKTIIFGKHINFMLKDFTIYYI